MEHEYPKPFRPKVGKTYRNHGGGEYICLDVSSADGRHYAIFENVRSGWNLRAVGVRAYSDGSIEWDYSTDGCFVERGA